MLLWRALKVILLKEEEEGFSNLTENIKFINYFCLLMWLLGWSRVAPLEQYLNFCRPFII